MLRCVSCIFSCNWCLHDVSISMSGKDPAQVMPGLASARTCLRFRVAPWKISTGLSWRCTSTFWISCVSGCGSACTCMAARAPEPSGSIPITSGGSSCFGGARSPVRHDGIHTYTSLAEGAF